MTIGRFIDVEVFAGNVFDTETIEVLFEDTTNAALTELLYRQIEAKSNELGVEFEDVSLMLRLCMGRTSFVVLYTHCDDIYDIEISPIILTKEEWRGIIDLYVREFAETTYKEMFINYL